MICAMVPVVLAAACFLMFAFAVALALRDTLRHLRTQPSQADYHSGAV